MMKHLEKQSMVRREHKYTEHNSRMSLAPRRVLRVLAKGQSPSRLHQGEVIMGLVNTHVFIHRELEFQVPTLGSGTQSQAVEKESCSLGKRE